MASIPLTIEQSNPNIYTFAITINPYANTTIEKVTINGVVQTDIASPILHQGITYAEMISLKSQTYAISIDYYIRYPDGNTYDNFAYTIAPNDDGYEYNEETHTTAYSIWI